MRVAMIGPFGLRPKGTMAVRALPLAKALARRGNEVALFLAPWSFVQDADRSWEEENVMIHNVPVSPRAIIAPRLVSRALRWRPDVVHCFKPKGYAGLAAWQLWQMRRLGRFKARLVVDTDDWEGAGGWNEIEKYSPLQKRFFGWQEQWGLVHCDVATTASRALETIVLSLGQKRDSTIYLPNGSTEAMGEGASIRSRLGHGTEQRILLYTRFVEFSVERLLAIFARILELGPASRLVVVGKGLFGEEKKLLELAEQRGLAEHISYVGWVEGSRLKEYFAEADLAIYPFDDTLINRCKCPVKLVDLLAAGVPVVAEAVGQNKEYILHNQTGQLVAPGSVEDFACAAAELLRRPDLSSELGRAAAAAMAREYNWDKLAEAAEGAYR